MEEGSKPDVGGALWNILDTKEEDCVEGKSRNTSGMDADSELDVERALRNILDTKEEDCVEGKSRNTSGMDADSELDVERALRNILDTKEEGCVEGKFRQMTDSSPATVEKPDSERAGVSVKQEVYNVKQEMWQNEILRQVKEETLQMSDSQGQNISSHTGGDQMIPKTSHTDNSATDPTCATNVSRQVQIPCDSHSSTPCLLCRSTISRDNDRDYHESSVLHTALSHEMRKNKKILSSRVEDGTSASASQYHTNSVAHARSPSGGFFSSKTEAESMRGNVRLVQEVPPHGSGSKEINGVDIKGKISLLKSESEWNWDFDWQDITKTEKCEGSENGTINDSLEASDCEVITVETRCLRERKTINKIKSVRNRQQFYRCDMCNEKFGSKYRIYNHMKRHKEIKDSDCHTSGKALYCTSLPNYQSKCPPREKAKFKCEICDKLFHLKYSLHNHMIRHSTERPHKCEVCDKSFITKREVHLHSVCHSENRPFNCELCSAAFKSSSSLAQHQRVHSNEKSFKCHVCGMAFKCRVSLTHHKTVHTSERPFECDLCGRTYKRINELQKHIANHYRPLLFECKICGKSFTSKQYIKRHVKFRHSESQPLQLFKCDLCNRAFQDKVVLRAHIVTHSDVYPFKCDVCQKMFKTRYNLKCHKPVHSELRSFKCELCDKKFKRKSYLNSHKNSHMESHSYRYKCEDCGRKFRTKSTLNDHIKSHLKKLSYKCDLCHRMFNSRSARTFHKRTHSNVRPYNCQVCSKAFKSKNECNMHTKIHAKKI